MKGFVSFFVWVTFVFCADNSFAKELPVKNFSQLPSYSRPALSPSGNQVAYIINFQNPEISVLASVNLKTGTEKFLIKSDNEKVKINWFKWANEKTLVTSVRFASKRYRVDTIETRLLGIDVESDEAVQRALIKPRTSNISSSQHFSQFQDNVVSFLPDDPEHIMVAVDLDTANQPSVYKLNINSRKKKRIARGKLLIRDWMADQQGNLRLGHALDYESGIALSRVLIGEDDKWHKMFEYNALSEPAITPIGFAKDPNILYYRAYKDDRLALFTIDLVSKETKLVFEDKDYDVDGSLIYSRKTHDVIGIYHRNSDNGRIYWDKPMAKLQKSLNKALKGFDNYLVDFSDDEQIYLLYSENDFTPGVYYIGDRNRKTLKIVFEQYPALIPEVLTEHEFVTYEARDGVVIEGYLTKPKGMKGPVPTILHPHGGPGSRESGGFDYWTSFFANRGYAVFRPNFRGSTGYGYAFAQSQMKGWGLTMQDDLTDAAKWLVEQKIADPERMCIVGASYGGYAAAMAAVKTPDLFKCAISFAGVTNLKTLVSRSRNYTNTKFVKNQIGDKSSDLKARSPYYHADKIKIPMLFIHGEDDRIVDVEHSRMMVDELEDLGKPVEYVELENGDHYLSIQRNRHRAFELMDKFLKTHLSE